MYTISVSSFLHYTVTLLLQNTDSYCHFNIVKIVSKMKRLGKYSTVIIMIAGFKGLIL